MEIDVLYHLIENVIEKFDFHSMDADALMFILQSINPN